MKMLLNGSLWWTLFYYFGKIIQRLEEIIMSKNNDIAIEVENVTKAFKLFYDKPSTLKERLVF